MNPYNKKIIWRMIQQKGDSLKDKLKFHPHHPKGRNSYAHVALCIKTKFNASYKDIPDIKFNDVINFIEFLKKNPS